MKGRETNSERYATVIFFPDTRDGRGFGHFKRCETLARSARALNCAILFCLNRREPFAEFLTEQGIDFEIVDWHSAIRGSLGRIAQSPIVKMQARQIWVFDSYDADYGYIREESPTGTTIVAIDDNADRIIDCDILINGNPFARYEEYETSKTPYLKLIGGQYCLTSSFAEVKAERATKKDRLKILVTFGGNGEQKLANCLTKTLINSGVSADIRVILPGTCEPHIVSAGSADAAVEILPAQATLSSHIRWADYVVCSASTVVYEAALSEVPVVCVETADNQRRLRHYLRNNGLLSFGPNEQGAFFAASTRMADLTTREKQRALIKNIGICTGANAVMSSILGSVCHETI